MFEKLHHASLNYHVHLFYKQNLLRTIVNIPKWITNNLNKYKHYLCFVYSTAKNLITRSEFVNRKKNAKSMYTLFNETLPYLTILRLFILILEFNNYRCFMLWILVKSPINSSQCSGKNNVKSQFYDPFRFSDRILKWFTYPADVYLVLLNTVYYHIQIMYIGNSLSNI